MNGKAPRGGRDTRQSSSVHTHLCAARPAPEVEREVDGSEGSRAALWSRSWPRDSIVGSHGRRPLPFSCNERHRSLFSARRLMLASVFPPLYIRRRHGIASPQKFIVRFRFPDRSPFVEYPCQNFPLGRQSWLRIEMVLLFRRGGSI